MKDVFSVLDSSGLLALTVLEPSLADLQSINLIVLVLFALNLLLHALLLVVAVICYILSIVIAVPITLSLILQHRLRSLLVALAIVLGL